MTKLQKVFIKNLRNERRKARLTQEKAAETIGITHSYYSALEAGAKFPSVQKLQDIGDAFRIPVYRLFIDRPNIPQMPITELFDLFVEFLSTQYQKDLVDAKAKFLKELETQKETGKNPFEGEEMFKE